jgi:hypothetical protein
MTINAFTKSVRRASLRQFGVEYSVSYYRKWFVTTALDSTTTPKEFVQKQAELASKMNNTTAIQAKYYTHEVDQPPTPRTIKPEPTLETIEFVINCKKVRVSGTNIKVEIISE